MITLAIMLLIGLLAGSFAAWFFSKTGLSFWQRVGVGIAGSFLGGAISSLLHGQGLQFETSGLIWSGVGSLLIIWGYEYYKKQNTPATV